MLISAQDEFEPIVQTLSVDNLDEPPPLPASPSTDESPALPTTKDPSEPFNQNISAEPPPLPKGSDTWYVKSADKIDGPMSQNTLEARIAAGFITAETLVGLDGLFFQPAGNCFPASIFTSSAAPPKNSYAPEPARPAVARPEHSKKSKRTLLLAGAGLGVVVLIGSLAYLSSNRTRPTTAMAGSANDANKASTSNDQGNAGPAQKLIQKTILGPDIERNETAINEAKGQVREDSAATFDENLKVELAAAQQKALQESQRRDALNAIKYQQTWQRVQRIANGNKEYAEELMQAETGPEGLNYIRNGNSFTPPAPGSSVSSPSQHNPTQKVDAVTDATGKKTETTQNETTDSTFERSLRSVNARARRMKERFENIEKSFRGAEITWSDNEQSAERTLIERNAARWRRAIWELRAIRAAETGTLNDKETPPPDIKLTEADVQEMERLRKEAAEEFFGDAFERILRTAGGDLQYAQRLMHGQYGPEGLAVVQSMHPELNKKPKTEPKAVSNSAVPPPPLPTPPKPSNSPVGGLSGQGAPQTPMVPKAPIVTDGTYKGDWRPESAVPGNGLQPPPATPAPKPDNSKAKSLINMAHQYMRVQNPEKAAEYAQKVIDDYPNTAEAEEAKTILKVVEEKK